VTITSVTDVYTLFGQRETLTAQVTAGGAPVRSGQVTFSDGGKTMTVGVDSSGFATATFKFGLLHEQPNAHGVSARFSDGTGTGTLAPSTLVDYLFQLYLDTLLLRALGL
jgi:hypothetical protein